MSDGAKVAGEVVEVVQQMTGYNAFCFRPPHRGPQGTSIPSISAPISAPTSEALREAMDREGWGRIDHRAVCPACMAELAAQPK